MTSRGVFGINPARVLLAIALTATFPSNLGMWRVRAYAEPTLTPVTPQRFMDMLSLIHI